MYRSWSFAPFFAFSLLARARTNSRNDELQNIKMAWYLHNKHVCNASEFNLRSTAKLFTVFVFELSILVVCVCVCVARFLVRCVWIMATVRRSNIKIHCHTYTPSLTSICIFNCMWSENAANESKIHKTKPNNPRPKTTNWPKGIWIAWKQRVRVFVVGGAE